MYQKHLLMSSILIPSLSCPCFVEYPDTVLILSHVATIYIVYTRRAKYTDTLVISVQQLILFWYSWYKFQTMGYKKER